ncbi:VOC family protein [Nocardia sp. NPDC004151]|uniref:VOC family protein n=1 Tax=Nocardia sp. NPDC004151 TaxID=3364304 RepID=UPI0036C5E900
MTTTGVPALKLEAVVIPVADVDRSKKFYDGVGWRLEADFEFDNGFRVVQFTPPGSPTSIQFGTSITTAKAGSAEGIYLVVSDVQQARDALAAQGADISEVFHPGAPGAQFQPLSGDGRVAGAADERASYGSFATFRDPDGNTFLLQEVTARIPGRIETTETSYATTSDLVDALVRAATAHGEHEARNGGRYDTEWPKWYAAYMVAEAHGDQLPE